MKSTARVVGLDRRAETRQKTVLITGGAGFLGSHLCQRLLAEGAKILCVDNLLSGRVTNISALMQHPDFSFWEHDVVDPLHIDGPLDEIYNMACAASPPRYQADPIHTFKTSALGAINLLDLAREKGARILQASTSEVYGDPNISPQSEDYFGNVNTFGPRSCYDEGKRSAETLFHDYAERHGVDIKIARIFNTYGPNMRASDGRVVSNFVIQALKGKPITVYGKGEQTRSFCFVDDLVDGLIRLMAAPAEVNFPINIGNPVEFTVRELAEIVLEKTGSRSALQFHPLPQDDPLQRRPDITRAEALLGWHPHVSLEKGLQQTIAYFQSELERKSARGAVGR
ncbi:NAD-dependent dehydratase [Actibacterium mucosum KCTC 23349]|uniref:UDP-glucuronate decarboxylase n=1 Tax=Actibacterium mucosum KCTC 23349 TaxID=1454373 RepID=A0A037ZHF1_9RHOB|nr:UDP-glucuronic acid decarboxylase family protein [Actibacterium mucosum]KAJ54947.1 NAD-dependent dehydratase [Actibacterium mucosum KCTC 23349]